MSVLNKSQDECIIDIRINWAGYFETMSVPLPVQTLSPGQQKVLSYHKPCRSICPKMLPLLLLPLSLQGRRICIFCVPAGGWTQPCLSDTLPWLPSHLSGGFWAGKACFLSAALVADATSLI